MRQIDEHPEPVHLAHDAVPEWCESVVPGRVERGIGPIERHVVSERHVSHAQIVVRAERAERILDGVSALQAKERGELALLELASNVGGTQRKRESVGILLDHSARDIYLLELHSGVARITVFAWSVDRPELRPDHSLSEPLKIRLAGSVCAEIVGIDVAAGDSVFADPPRQIVVAVDERRRLENAFGAGEVTVVGSRGCLCMDSACRTDGNSQQRSRDQ